ncbi:Mur ligase family protein [Anaerobranca gottschalkii]|uniref:UDP-N-acetylmuramoylalanyl-D-glutamate--2,6-diaminopimelate ligase n=1 Tax=Anaerobranca gottschalkii DSM 13577 TaxID=1120990 RepID=A0A1H9YTP9_9FIRM|nr:UDP-N-acetylmuramyl-tripeptide synthetase [Anaerobranca gottschalkii]SES72504.1 UDP-N-acetylmuramoylalanyl-D-glutamate--2,6-diaminopimelate ligase [Anaerobranca gottschalkii DSM 13577]
MIELQKMISVLEGVETLNYNNILVKGIAYHTDRVEEGYLFVCIKGYQTDGHFYAQKAVEKGASVLIVEKFIKGIDVPQIKVLNSRKALAQISALFYGYPSKDMVMIGVTGTNGKTTTSFLIDRVLQKAYGKTGLIGTVIVKNGDSYIPAELTTPESLDLQRYLWEMKENNIKYTTMEVSSSGLDLNRVDTIDYKIAVVNNISRDHIDLHGSYENYVNAKKKLVKNLKADSVAILNGDCTESLNFGLETIAPKITFGIKNSFASVVAESIDLSKSETSYRLKVNETLVFDGREVQPQEFEVKLKILGLHNVYNSLVAATVGLIMGVDIADIQKALYEFRGVERRFQLIYNDEFKIIDDHFANPGNIRITLDTIKKMSYSQFSLVYAIRGSRGVTVNSENARVIAENKELFGLKNIILTTSNDYVGKKDLVTDDELNCVIKILEEGGIKTQVYPNLEEAIKRAIDFAQKDSLILLGGCQGMDYGAKIALDYIYQKIVSRQKLSVKKLKELKEKIYEPLKDRVAGI